MTGFAICEQVQLVEQSGAGVDILEKVQFMEQSGAGVNILEREGTDLI